MILRTRGPFSLARLASYYNVPLPTPPNPKKKTGFKPSSLSLYLNQGIIKASGICIA